MESIPDHIKQMEESIKFCTIIDKYCAELSKLCFKMLDNIDYLTKIYNIDISRIPNFVSLNLLK